ncbi:MAG: hypothetical protein HOC09_33110 [Deltaproteobacteria bacterium]|jgi:hypothetical protein|nr:hypothetical protein [Deltaproteobacteria bacterium]
MTSDTPARPRQGMEKKCPFIPSPDKDCFFLDMNSNKISMVLFYCRNHYQDCAVYKRLKLNESGHETGKANP